MVPPRSLTPNLPNLYTSSSFLGIKEPSQGSIRKEISRPVIRKEREKNKEGKRDFRWKERGISGGTDK